MKKEVLIAIIIGFGIGLIITYGIYTAQTAIKNRTGTVQNTTTDSEINQKTQEHTVHIVSPETETVSSEEEITLSGTTTPDSYIVILTSAEEYITRADQTGSFAKEITLEAGANFVTVTSISPNNIKATAQTTVSYTTASLTPAKDSTASATTNSEDEN